MVSVPLHQLDSELALPSYARPGDAGADLRASRNVVLPARGGRALVPTGIAVAIPEGHAGLVLPRSGLALRHGVTCLNTPGLIDAGYRGEILVLLINHDPEEDYAVSRGDRVAQLVIVRVEEAAFTPVPVEGLGEATRGAGGFGHTGT
jgi:dUTP pyrophosphatase